MSLNLTSSKLYCKVRISVMTKKLYLLLTGMALCFSLLGQTEAEVLSQANKLFKNESYVKATPLYLRLLSLSPKNTDYNFRYGTCLLFNADRKQEALRYLKFAAEDPKIDPLAFYFLGKAYHVNYLFNDAVRSYDKFSAEADSKVASNYPTTRLIQTCQNGRKLLMNYSEMIVFDKKEIEAEKFFRLYDLDGIGGNIVVTAEYQSKLDKKRGHIPLIYFGKGATEIFYSSYGESGNNGKEIYRKRREPTGAWGKSELINGQVNTKYDEDYCYLSQDGQYLYFSSKGHNSMGGYDVFRSKYDESSDSFGEAENMDFAVSSPNDDIFFLVDAKNENGYFASARQSEVGKLYVYKIRVDKLPTQLSVIAGRYQSKISDTPPQLKVQVENSDGSIVGNFESNSEGNIILSFPTGGQYKYKMTLQGSSEVYFANVNVPFKRNIKPIRQSFMHFMENDKEVVRVLDRFDEAVAEREDILAALFAEKANLDPNADKFDLKSLGNQKEKERILAEVGAEGWSLSEVATEMEGKARAIREMEDRAGETEKKAATLIEDKIKLIEDLNQKLAENAVAYREAEANSMTRQNLLVESKELLAQKEESEDKVQDLLDINRKVQENLVLYKDIKLRATDWEKKGAELQQLLSEDKNAEALQLIALNKVIVNSAITDTVIDYQTVTTNEISQLNKDLTTMHSLKFNYETSSKDLQNNIDYLERFLIDGTAEDPKETKKNIERKKQDLVVIHGEIKNIEESVKSKRVVKERLTDELSEYKELDNSPMPNRIAQMQVAKDHWNSIKNQPNEKEAVYLAEVIKDIEDGNIAVTDPIDPQREALNPNELLEIVNPEFNTNIAAIENNVELSSIDKASQLEALEQQNATLIAEQIQKVKSELTESPDDVALAQEQKSLEAMLTEAQDNANKYNDAKEVELSKELATTIDQTYVLEAIDNTYDKVKSHLEEDSNLDGIAQLTSLNEHDEDFLDKIEDRQNELKDLLKSDPNKAPQFEKEINILNDVASEKEGDLAVRKTELENLVNVAATNPVESAFSKMAPKEQELTLLSEIDATYIDKKESFDDIAEPQLTDLQNELALDNAILESLLEKKESYDPATQQDEIKAVERILIDAKSDIANNESKVADIESQLALTSPTESAFSRLAPEKQELAILNEVDATYLDKKKTFDAIAEPQVTDLQSEIVLDNTILKSLNEKKESFDPATQQDEIAAIDRLLTETESDISNNETKIADIESQLALVDPVESAFSKLTEQEQKESILNELNKSYSEQKKSFNEIDEPQLVDLKGMIAISNALLEDLKEKKTELDREIQQDEINTIDQLLSETQADINDNQAKIEEIENQLNLAAAAETQEELINRIASGYSSQVEGVQNADDLSELEKTKQLVALDESLMTSLNEELNEVSNLASSNPSYEGLESKQSLLNEIIAEKSQLLSSRQDKIDKIESQLAVVDPILNFSELSEKEQEALIQEKMDLTYEEDVQAINDGSGSDSDKLSDLIALDKTTQSSLSEEKANLDPETEANEIAAIERIEEAVKSSLSNNQMNMLALTETSEELIGRVQSDYQEKKDAIENNTEKGEIEKLEELIALEKGLQSILDREREQFERLGNDNPQVPALREKAKEIQDLLSNRHAAITLNEQELSNLESQLAATDPNENPTSDNIFAALSIDEQETAMLEKVNADYAADKEQLESKGLDSKKEIEDLLNLNKKTLKQLANEKSSLSLEENENEISAIERVESQLNGEIKEGHLNLRALPETTEELISRIAETDSEDLAALLNDDRLTEIEKTEKAIEINQEMKSSLKKELGELKALSSDNPDNERLAQKVAEVEVILGTSDENIASLYTKLEELNGNIAVVDPSNTAVAPTYKSIEEIRSEFLSDVDVMESEANSIEGLKEQIQKLETYEADLKELDANYEDLESTNGENHKKARRFIGEELVEIENKKRKASISIGELEIEVENATANTLASTNAKYDDAGLEKIVDQENKLREELNSEVSMKKARKIEKKLIETIDQRIEKENDITQKIVSNTQDENEDKLKKIKNIESNSVTERLSIELAETKYNEINDEARALEDQAKKAGTPQEESELLAKSLEKQNEATELLESSYIDAKVDRLTKGKINSLMTNAELQVKRKNLLVEESNINAQIDALDTQIKLATKEKDQDRLYAERKALVEKRTRVDNSIAGLDRKIADSPQKGISTIPANAAATELTYLEERKIAETEDYKKLSSAAFDAVFLEGEINFLLKSIDKEKLEAQELVQESLDNPSDEIDQLILNKIESIQEKQGRLNEYKIKLANRQTEIDQLLPKGSEQLAHLNNMLSRGVEPMSKFDAVEFVPIPQDGFSINATTQTQTVKAKPIVTETPSGLMYRVQVGAFSKPVAEDVFNEFTPVSAEKRDNGILVYMAGFFVGNEKARDAQKSIRGIGYTDAFVVAYCDGKRITLSEAQRLEESKACTPIQLSDISIQAEAPKDTTKVMITELDYYKAIGAAPALPVETKKGLFYTVQLGVYNRPVGKEVLKNMSPLITKRLPNGQIRYSAGVYVSIEEAFPKRSQAFDKGIGDAYITAYYGGERITLAEAEKLLQTEGTGIIEKTAIGIVKDVDSRLKAEEKLAADIKEIVKNEKVEGLKIQMISKKQYDEFPRDILNRFNSHASFYFDINDKRIKSSLFEKVDDIPQIYFLRNELDTIYISDMERIQNVKNNDLRNISFEISSQQLGGDLTDLLLRLNYRKEFIQVGEVIVVRVHEIPTNNVQSISDRLRALKIRSDVEDPAR